MTLQSIGARWLAVFLATVTGCFACAANAAELGPADEGTTILVDTFLDDLNSNEDGLCSLREAVRAARLNIAVDGCPAGMADPAHDRVELPAGSYELLGQIEIRQALSIHGASAATTEIVANPFNRGFTRNRHFYLQGGSSNLPDLHLESLTLSGGDSNFGGSIVVLDGSLSLRRVVFEGNMTTGPGGAVLVRDDATELVVEDCLFRDNLADSGGAILVETGDTTILNSTFSGNHAVGGGSALDFGGGVTSITHSSFASNPPEDRTLQSNGIGQLILANNLIAGGCLLTGPGTRESRGGNFAAPESGCPLTHPSDGEAEAVGERLGPLMSAPGDPTPTLAPLPGNPAIDGALELDCPVVDQRGEPRPVDGDGDGLPRCDAGAHEAAACSGSDSDGDGWPDPCDNCPGTADPTQIDTDGDGLGDACDPCIDVDGDTICDQGAVVACLGGETALCNDNCAHVANPDQADADGDALGDACDEGTLITVDRDDDDIEENGSCSLREALRAANINEGVDACPAGQPHPLIDRIEIPAGTYELTQEQTDEDEGKRGDLDILDSVILRGAGADVTTIDARGIDRVLHIDPFREGIHVEIEGLTLTGSDRQAAVLSETALSIREVRVEGNEGFGLHIRRNAQSTEPFVLRDSLLTDNQESALFLDQVHGEISGATFAQNHSRAIEIDGVQRTTRIENSTFLTESRTGISVNNSDAEVRNCTIDGTPSSDAFSVRGSSTLWWRNSIMTGDCQRSGGGAIISESGNIKIGTRIRCGIDPEDGDFLLESRTALDLSTLQDHGGPVPTLALGPTSAAIDAGTGADGCAKTDQRGALRPVDGDAAPGARCDSGAYERGGTIAEPIFADDFESGMARGWIDSAAAGSRR